MRPAFSPTAEFLEAHLLFEHLVALVLPTGYRTERVPFSETPFAAEVQIWQGEERQFSLLLPAGATQLVMDQCQRFVSEFQRKQDDLVRPLSDEELRLLARPLLLELLRKLDDYLG